MKTVSMELQKLIDKEKLVQDAMKLERYKCEDKTLRLIDEVRNELANETDDMTEITTIYQFAETLKERIR